VGAMGLEPHDSQAFKLAALPTSEEAPEGLSYTPMF
tara:strand:- start:583 stop:690 length:108 start_codon:yes stop_codon:yes gene_type:complete